MKTYMGFSRWRGPEEGAVLIFAHTAKEAKKVCWRRLGGDMMFDEYIDCAVNIIKDAPWLFKDADQKKLDADVPHVVDNPTSCKICGRWGAYEIGKDGICESCEED